MPNANLPTYALNAVAVAARAAEVPDADFSGGMNFGACANGVGINTGNYDPKDTDWPRIEDTAAHETQHIGGNGLGDGSTDGFVIQVVDGADINDNVAFVQADASTAPDAVLDAATGAVNKTGETVPAGSWAWGVIPVA